MNFIIKDVITLFMVMMRQLKVKTSTLLPREEMLLGILKGSQFPFEASQSTF